MQDRLIDDVIIKELKVIQTKDTDDLNNGWLIDILRATDEVKIDGDSFGQIYLTTANENSIKGFHLHKTKTDHFCVIRGLAKMVLIDNRKGSQTYKQINEIIMGEENFKVVRVPVGVKHAFKNIGNGPVYMLNYMTPAFDVNHPDTITTTEDYDW